MDPRGRRPRLRNVPKPVGLAAAGVVAAGAAFGGVTLASGGSQAPAAAGQPNAQTNAQAASGPTGQAAALNALLASAGGSSQAAGSSAGDDTGTGRAGWKHRHHRHGRLGEVRMLGGMYGQFTFTTAHGTKTIAFERGTVTSVTATTLVIKAKNGTTWTWQITPNTRVRDDRKLAKPSDITDGEQVFTGGQVTNGARDARIVIVRAKGAAQ